ncbi:nuclear transport factor 2A-like [Lotus japonicus]|uniref:nuclear transport factor 2A-like n=1 Tax=Lotus japonicus TaxID=34305 RepID=UPI002588F3E5|nr:nuclear transport factor 2A-like [Lotus japonicus]
MTSIHSTEEDNSDGFGENGFCGWRREEADLSFEKMGFAGGEEKMDEEGGRGEIKMDPDALAKAFMEHYYSTFDSNCAALANLYQEGSMLSFEGQKIQGSQNIVAKLTSLPFQQRHHSITTVDCQPSGANAAILVFVSGNRQTIHE